MTRKQEGDEAANNRTRRDGLCWWGTGECMNPQTNRGWYCKEHESPEAALKLPATVQPEDETTLPALGIDIKDYNRSNVHVEFRQEELEIRERQLKQAIADCVTAKDLGDRAVELGLELGRREAAAIERADKAEAERDALEESLEENRRMRQLLVAVHEWAIRPTNVVEEGIDSGDVEFGAIAEFLSAQPAPTCGKLDQPHSDMYD